MIEKTLTLASGLMFWVFIIWALGHWWVLIRALFGKRNRSILPLIPGILGTTALLIAPAESELSHWHSYWWIPLIADIGCVPWLIYYLVWRVSKRHE